MAEVSTLTDICLNSICKNIDRYNAAFHNSKDKNMKRNMFVLRRLYSNQIMKLLMDQSSNFCLDKKYFDFLINEYLKELDFYIFRRNDLNIIMEMLPIMGKTLENVSFNFQEQFEPNEEESYLEHYVKKALLHLTNVKVIRMMHLSNCCDSTLEAIYSSCKELKELYLNRCPITSAGLKSLCPEDKMNNAFNLQSLGLEDIKDCDEGVSYLLQKLPSLECIIYVYLANVLHKLHAYDLRNNSLHTVPKYNLTSLDIDIFENFHFNEDAFEETLVIASELCPLISKIDVFGITTEEELQILFRFRHLSHVSVDGYRIRFDIGDFLQHSGEKIRHLEIGRFRLTLSTLVENCPNLESLRLDYLACYMPEKEKSLNILKNMRKLILADIDENHEIAEIVMKLLLDSCPNLDELEFIGYDDDGQLASDVIPKYCEKSQTLEKLTFKSCAVEVTLLQQIVLTCTPLKKLVIDDLCRIIGSHDIENLRDIIRASNRGVVVDVTSGCRFQFDSDSSDEDNYLNDLVYEDVYHMSDESWDDAGDDYDNWEELADKLRG